jgi:stage V sporulation protein D (sporulation-specific penicillin-binding protein)
MLLTLDEPSRDTGTYVSGGNMVAPVASSVMAELLPYLGIEPTYSAEELVGADATVPNLVGEKADEAAKKLKELGFGCRLIGDAETVTDQTPLGGAIVPNNAEILLYCGEEKSDAPCIVPNVIGDSASVANQKLTNAGLIMSISGATNRSSASVRAISQSEEPGKEVPAGTVVRVQLSDSSVTD